MAPGTEDLTDGSDVAGAGIVVKDVEEAAVDYSVECLAEGVGAEHIEDVKGGVHSSLGGLAPGGLNGERRDVDADGSGAMAGGQDSVFTRATPSIKECARQRTGVGETDECPPGGGRCPTTETRRRTSDSSRSGGRSQP
jgi:hypothetical protein